MNSCECHIRFKDHAVYIHIDDQGHIVCFKYDLIRCDIESFDDQDQASDYIFTPFQDLQYYIEVADN